MAKLNSYKYSFFVRVIPIWNSLPEYVAEAESLMAFKERLRIHYGLDTIYRDYKSFFVVFR